MHTHTHIYINTHAHTYIPGFELWEAFAVQWLLL